jgi:branched-chain amino acid transport system ATP-binding protein
MAHAPGAGMSLLSARSLSRRFAGVVAVDAVDIDMPEGGVHAVIGPNGAGKTTLFNLLSGLDRPTAGDIAFDGRTITRLPSHRRAALGIARTFQNIRVFATMTVLENVLTGLHPRLRAGLPAIVAGWPSVRREERLAMARAREALEVVGLLPRAADQATALPYGDQRRLEIARAIVGRPRLLLLDEPAAGMNPSETVALGALIHTIVGVGTTVLLVEHNMPFVMGLSDSVTVLNFGRCIFSGPPEEARRDPGVIEAYLGAKIAARLARSW